MTDAHVLYAVENLKVVVDTVCVARLTLTSGDTVIPLIPRHETLTHVKKTQMLLYALEDAQPRAEVQGKTRIPVAEDDGRYTGVGLKPNRSSKGITQCWPKKLNENDRRRICKFMTTSRCEDVAKGYVTSNELRELQIAQLLAQWPETTQSICIWYSFKCHAASVTDHDF